MNKSPQNWQQKTRILFLQQVLGIQSSSFYSMHSSTESLLFSSVTYLHSLPSGNSSERSQGTQSSQWSQSCQVSTSLNGQTQNGNLKKIIKIFKYLFRIWVRGLSKTKRFLTTKQYVTGRKISEFHSVNNMLKPSQKIVLWLTIQNKLKVSKKIFVHTQICSKL